MTTATTARRAEWRAARLDRLPPYLFVETDRKKAAARAAGRDIIDFGVGDPDLPTPTFILDRIAEASRDATCHRYSPGRGTVAFRKAAAEYMSRRFGAQVDPETQILALLGSKEGIGHLPTAIIDPDDIVLVPEPGYPVYSGGTALAGGVCHGVPLRASQGWLPVFEDILQSVAERAKLLFLNYPNNPTSACATLSFFERAVAFGRAHDVLIAHDAAYIDVHYGDPPPSILQVAGAAEVCIEFHSLSKTFNMTGWRLGFAAGHAGVLRALAKLKENLDSGPVPAVQAAGAAALRGSNSPDGSGDGRAHLTTYRRRRDVLVEGLRRIGWNVKPPTATFFVWAGCPDGMDSMTVASRALDEADVVLIPGRAFGPQGEGYVRFALTVDAERIATAVERLARVRW